MKRKNFSKREITKFLADIDEAHSKGMTVKEACELIGISQQSYYRHKAMRNYRPTRTKPVEDTNGVDYQAENERLRALVLSLMGTLIRNGILPDTMGKAS